MAAKALEGIQSIEDFDLTGQRVFLRLDLNVPMKEGVISDDTRIRAALPTIRYALEHGAKLVVASHWGRPKTPEDRQSMSLEPIARHLSDLLGVEVILVEEPKSDAPKALLRSLKPQQMILLENLRFDEDEEKNGERLAKAIAQYTDIYINDAFGASHRAHSSIVALPAEISQKGVGFLMKREIEMLDKILYGHETPFIAVLGGAKVSDKIPVIENLIDRVDALIIGGAMAYTFLAAQGVPVGKSLVEKDRLKFTADLMGRMEARNKRLLLPIDHLTVKDLKVLGDRKVTSGVAIDEGWMGVDIGPRTIAIYKNELMRAKTVFWNGPMGIFEMPELSRGTFAIAEVLSENGGVNIVGGGDSAAAANQSGFAERMTHISTGGGASLEYLQGLRLPGVEALRAKRRSQ